MKNRSFGSFLVVAGLAVSAWGCVSDRPSRNGVFNENQYVRKDFLIRPGTSDTNPDPGWMLKATVTQTSSPNPLGDNFGIFTGSENGGALVRFVVTQDKLQMKSMREIAQTPDATRTEEVVNAWPVTNVDIMYRINLDGEKTNFLEENQEQDWQQRQWVKVSFDKNDMSDVAPLGSYTAGMLDMCTDAANATATLVPGSFVTDDGGDQDPSNDYMEWTVQIALPLSWMDATCVTAFGFLGDEAARLGRNTVTFNLKYSMTRANPAPDYPVLEVAEKDPIRHKYGPIEYTTIVRDNDSGQLAARELVMRFDPRKPITWYFEQGFPADYKKVFLDPKGIKDQTNALLEKAGVQARVDFKEWNDGGVERHYGDVRYSFLRWISDRDMQSYWAGVTQFVPDPRTGETLSASINFNDFAIKDYYVQRIDGYLQSLGASLDINSDGEWGPPIGPDGKPITSCKDGDTAPLIPATARKIHDGASSMYQKMQAYLQKPVAQYGNLGPQDFIVKQDQDFFNAYYQLLPYYIFADPAQNPFVIPEGGAGTLGPGQIWKSFQDEAAFQAMAAKIDRGEEPYQGSTGPDGVKNATAFLNEFKRLTLAHKDFTYKKNFLFKNRFRDAPDAFSFEAVMNRDARHCVNGQWESKKDWEAKLIQTYWSQVIWHEFGHALGLEHNFMGSVDAPNYMHAKDAAGNDHVGLYSNSVMEYNAAPDRVFWASPDGPNGGWAPYDKGAITWIYANTKNDGKAPSTTISGQSTASSPWMDPWGFQDDGKTERQFLFCDERHLAYTPFCRQGDLGTTPSEIIANELDNYEWQYQWRNFRTYRKIWDDSQYANGPAAMIVDMRRFLSLWLFDWSTGELADTMRRAGIKNPDPNGSDLEYFGQLTNKFNMEASAANQMVAAFHKAVIQQSAGERPYKTVYDKYYGDVTQQGIILDKLFAMQGYVGIWPADNYDQNQAGTYIASYSGVGDSSYEYVAEDAVTSMIGGQYDVYPYFVPLAVAQFAQDTHDPAFEGRIEARDWIGGHVFTRLDDFLAYFRDIAVQNNLPGCPDVASCTYDPRAPSISDNHNEFFGPDKRKWIWAYVPDRNQWVAVQKERNVASYVIVRNFNDYVVAQLDDGAFPGGAYPTLLPVKFFLDSFNTFN
jgi:hypothetical protein